MQSQDSLNKRMEYAQDVAGWKSVIFLPYQIIWQYLIMITILYAFSVTTNMVTYHLAVNELIYVCYFCDLLYLTDVSCSVLHHTLKGTRKLRNFRPKPWLLLLVDLISLIPLELVYTVVYNPKGQHDEVTGFYMYLNRTVRIYRFYYYFIQSHVSVRSVAFGPLFSYLQLFVYGFCMSHSGACIYQFLKTKEELKECRANPYECMLLNEMNIFSVMALRFFGNKDTYNTFEKRLACSIFMTLGYFYVYGLMAPMFIFSCLKRLRTFFEFWNRFQRLKIFVGNLIEDDNLKKKTLEEFRTVWTYGKGDVAPELLKSFPGNLRKNVYSDIYWDAMRHSDLLQKVSLSCKKSLSVHIVGDFYMPDTVFWDIGENKNCMLYLASGILQIMAEENSKSPIMSFSGGTVLGESTIFFPGRSKAILRVATFSEIHVLYAKDFFRVIQNYPEDRAIILENLKLRLQIAKMTHIRKKEISKVIFNKNMSEIGDFAVDEDDSVKWIKTQFRTIALMNDIHSKFGQEYQDQTAKTSKILTTMLNDLKTGIDHTSIYLPLLNLGEEIEVLTDVTCLKTSIPWVIDPHCHFIRHWRFVILVLILFSSLIYPVFVAWWVKLPSWLFDMSQFISMFYIIDIFVQLSTAIKTKDVFIVSSGGIFRYRLKTLSFYADFISAIPLQMILSYMEDENTSLETYIRLSITIALIKIYKILIFLTEWCQTLKGRVSSRVMIKYIFCYFLGVYWSAAVLHLVDVVCLFDKCREGRWYDPSIAEEYPEYKVLAAAFFSVAIFIDVPNTSQYHHNYPSLVFVTTSLAVMQFLLMGWFGEFNAAYMLEKTQEITFENLLQSVINFMNERNIVGRIKKRVLDTMFFQWHYDCGDYMTQQRAMLEDVPQKLKREVNKATIFKVIKSCEIFHSESEAFVWYLCRKGSRLALPSNSIILTFGIQTMTLYIIYKGYLQVNSFLPKDILDGVATPLLYGPGKILPIVIALNQMPSSVTARALTDCELIVISLEDLLTGCILNNCFKDFIEAIKKTDLTPYEHAKLTISKVTNVFNSRMDNFREPFRKLKAFGWVLRLVLMKKFINSEGIAFLRWELFRLFSFVVAATCWPVVFVLLMTNSRLYLLYALLALDSFGWIDFYIRLHVGFYNKKGIYVTHPLSTSWHYLTTSFSFDFIAFLPYLHSLYIVSRNPDYPVTDDIVIIHSVVRILSLYRVFLFITNFEDIGTVTLDLKTLGYTVLILISLNCFILIKMRTEVKWSTEPGQEGKYNFTKGSWIKTVGITGADTAGEMYVVMVYCLTMLIFRCYPFFTEFTYSVLVYIIVFPMVGMIFIFFGNAFFISRNTGAKLNFTIYQYHMKSLTHFLKNEKAEDTISSIAISHFEHEWERKQGEDLHKVFSRFPNILEEDLMYPIYRNTLLMVPCFSAANEAFHRTLSRVFVEVFFKKGSTILFEKGVHKDIYFVHKGQCNVTAGDVLLNRGSMMGDIQGKGIMKNNIFARTHVVLLKITSPEFFLILNNFYQTEVAYFDALETVDDYITSSHTVSVVEDQREVLTWAQEVKEWTECEFEMADEMSVGETVTSSRAKVNQKLLLKLHPNSLTSKILRIIFTIDAIATAFFIPLIIGLRLATKSALGVMYFLDALWVVKIVTTMRTAYISPDTGNLVTKTKDIFKNYVRTSDGFVVDVLSIYPFEYVHMLIKYFYNDWSDGIRKYCYIFRLLRLLSLWIRVSKEKKKLSLTDRTRWFIIIMRQIISYNFLTAINLLLATDDRMKVEDYQTEYSDHLMEALLWSYFSMFNVYTGAGFYILPPSNIWQITFYIFIALLAVLQRNILTSEVLSIINVSFYVKSEKLFKMQLMDKYLAVRDVSPALKSRLLNYACDLLEHYKWEVVPWFLKNSPYYIRVQIMQDLYLQYLTKCDAFQGLNPEFLKQLAARLERHIYFPSDVVAEKGDVDCTMYFVHKGEVASIEKDPLYHGLDYETNAYKAGNYFGVGAGLARSVPHTTTYRAISKADLLCLNYFDWEDLRLAFPEVTEIINKRSSELKEKPDSVFSLITKL